MSDKTAEKPALRKPEFVKVADLERGRSGYNVYVQVVSCEEREVETREGNKIKMIDAVVADDTGAAKAFFKGDHAKDIKKGSVIAIRNGVKKIIKGHISLQLDIFGRVTLENQKKIEPKTDKNISDEEVKFERRDRQPRRNRPFRNNRSPNRQQRGDRKDRRDRNDRSDRNDRNDRFDRNDRYDRPPRNDRGDRGDRGDRNRDRDYDRPRRDRDYDGNRRPRNNDRDYDRQGDRNRTGGGGYRERREEGRYNEKRGDRKPMVKINEISPGEQNIRFIAKVISCTLISGRNGSNFRCVLGDETGLVNGFLQESEHLVVGKTVALFGAEARVVKEHIEIQRARVEIARNAIDKVNDKFNLSEKSWVPVD